MPYVVVTGYDVAGGYSAADYPDARDDPSKE